MIGLLLASVLLSGGIQPAAPPPAEAEVVISDCRLGVADPHAFVAATYTRYQTRPNEPPPFCERAVYSPRLRALFDAYDAWQHQHPDEVGALDFDWWTNAQDYSISHLALSELNEGPELRWVIARFDNYDRHDEVRFRFVRQHGRWYLDDAMQGTGRGGDGWTLSALLQSREQ